MNSIGRLRGRTAGATATGAPRRAMAATLERRVSRHGAALAATLLAIVQLSCASMGLTPDTSSMPAARAGLRPEYRIFYDELQDYGDWVLIEPYGFVFRPRTRFDTWSPYWDGFWSPSDSYGWVWVSAEPFGWATYHYGRWFDDDYQGWVWMPGVDWAPAWVAWAGNDRYVGWAALGPGGDFDSPGAGSNFHFAARSDLGSTDIRSRLVSEDRVASIAKQSHPIRNVGEVDQVPVNLGPPIEWVEQAAGPLRRARLEDVATGTRERLRSAPAPAAEGRARAARPAEAKGELQRTAETEARRVRTIMQQKQSPPLVIPRLAPIQAKVRKLAQPQQSRTVPAPPDSAH